ncbi:MAG: FAD/NAD(P)-binding oxidoreductase [Caldilineaceae bacterium]
MAQYKYLIVGGGMTANAAMKGIRSIDQDGTIGVISAEADRPYDRPPLTKGLWKNETNIDKIVHELPAGVELHPQRRVRSLSIPKKEVMDDQEQIYSYEKLLLATGGTPKRLPFDDEGKVLYYRTLRDYRNLRRLTEQYEKFVVIGGSFIGSELAAALNLNNKDVTLIFPEDSICARLLPADVSGYLNRYYESKGVTVQPSTKLTGIEGELGHYQLQTDQQEEITAEVVVAGIGIAPDVALAETAGLRVANGIMVNGGLQTSAPNIYAAGDVANFEDKVLGERRRVEHEDNATAMGEAAGRAMAGAKITYDYSPMFYSDLFDLGYEAVGKLQADLTTYVDWQEEYTKGVIYYLQDNRVCGVLLWNVWKQLDAARALIASREKLPTSALKGRIG